MRGLPRCWPQLPPGCHQAAPLPVQAAAQEAGVPCKLVEGRGALASWTFAPDGRVLDGDGDRVDNVWKSWRWPTAIDDSSDADLDYFVSLIASPVGVGLPPGAPERPDLKHVLLDPRVRVFEPLWTILPASKAILPLLPRIRPHETLLPTSFEWSPELSAAGFATKPVFGRLAKGVELHDVGAPAPPPIPAGQDSIVFQARCDLPCYGDHYVQVIKGTSVMCASVITSVSSYVQVNTCVVQGRCAGTVLRVSKNAIVDYFSDTFALRIVADDFVLSGVVVDPTASSASASELA